MKHTKFLKNVAVISAGGLIAKGLGALYRIPLVGFLGGYGTGLYQMAYPLFCVVLTFSSAGIPSAFSRFIAAEVARGRDSTGTVKTALALFALLGLCGTLLMCVFAPYMSALQGDGNLLRCYFALAPSVVFVAFIAVLRGYFQGKSDMMPTAVSEIVEQSVKAGAGLFFAYRFAAEPARAVMYTLFAVTLSEIVAALYLYFRYRIEPRRKTLRVLRVSGGEIFRAALPVMLATSLLPLSQTVDSILIVRLLSVYSDRAVSLYGLFTGGALALINLPATFCYGLAAASVPAVSSCFARGETQEGTRRAVYALGITLLLSVPCAIGLFVLAGPVVKILFSSLGAEDAALLIRLIRLCSVSAVFLAGVNTLAACLTGMGRAKYAALSMLVAVLVKFALQWLLVTREELSIGGAAIAANACYLVAFSLDLFYTVKRKKHSKERAKHDYDYRSGNRERGSDGAGAERNAERGQGTSENGSVPVGGGLARSGNCVRNPR